MKRCLGISKSGIFFSLNLAPFLLARNGFCQSPNASNDLYRCFFVLALSATFSFQKTFAAFVVS